MMGVVAMDERIKYWTKDDPIRNFGDDLSRLLSDKILLSPLVPSDIYHLIGSVINRHNVFRDLTSIDGDEKKITFWCCGARDETDLEEWQHQHCNFRGARGPLTREVLKLPPNTPMGDPALLVPLIHEPRIIEIFRGRSVCVPHLTQSIAPDRLLTMSGADIPLTAGVRSDQELRDLIDVIVSSDFVLTGALHVAIVACAYGRPFAFWDTGFVDIPFKWQDFAASVGIACEFVTNLDQGRAYYDRIRADIRLPKLAPILECCPFHVRPEVMHAAIASDAQS